MKQFDKDNIVAGPYLPEEVASPMMDELAKCMADPSMEISEEFCHGFLAATCFLTCPEGKHETGMNLEQFINEVRRSSAKARMLMELGPIGLVLAHALR